MESDWTLTLLVFGPAVVGLVALVLSVLLLAHAGTATQRDTGSMLSLVSGAILLIVALGIGSCYGFLFLGG